MATMKQLEFIDDCERGVAAIKSQGRNPTKIGEVLEASGRYLTELNAVANRMANKGNYNEIIRLQKIFGEVGLKSRCIENLLIDAKYAQSNEPVKVPAEKILALEKILAARIEADKKGIESEEELEQSMPIEKYAEVKPLWPAIDRACPSDALTKVIDILAPLSQIYKSRVLQSAGLFLGVGE